MRLLDARLLARGPFSPGMAKPPELPVATNPQGSQTLAPEGSGRSEARTLRATAPGGKMCLQPVAPKSRHEPAGFADAGA